jgi:hypothetical protein
MSHKQFISDYKSVSLDYLVSTPKALRILLIHRRGDNRFQSLLFKSVCTLLAVLGAGICVFTLVPTFLALSIVAQGVCLFSLLLWLRAGDIFLEFALEDEWFFDLAMACQALSIFEDTEVSLPQHGN